MNVIGNTPDAHEFGAEIAADCRQDMHVPAGARLIRAKARDSWF